MRGEAAWNPPCRCAVHTVLSGSFGLAGTSGRSFPAPSKTTRRVTFPKRMYLNKKNLIEGFFFNYRRAPGYSLEQLAAENRFKELNQNPKISLFDEVSASQLRDKISMPPPRAGPFTWVFTKSLDHI